MKRLLVGVAAVLAVAGGPSWGRPSEPGGEGPRRGRSTAAIVDQRGPAKTELRLASQTAWVGPGQELVLRLLVTTPLPPSDVEVAVALYRRVASRSEFAATGQARPRATPLSVTPPVSLSDLPPDPGGAVVMRLAIQDPALPPDRARVRLRDEGVYPVRVELREAGGGATLAELVTHLIYASQPAEGGEKLRAALVLPVHAPPSLRATGGRRLSEEAADALAALPHALEARPDVPVTLEPTPETLEALATSPRPKDQEALAGLARAAQIRQVVGATYVPVALPAFAAAGVDAELAAQLDRGNQVIGQYLGTRPDPRTWVASDRLDEAAVEDLRRHQVDRLVVPETSLAPTDLPVTLAQPFELDVRALRRPRAIAGDPALAAHFAPDPDPVLAGHRLLADCAVIYFDHPGRSRAVVALPPRSWRPTGAFLDTVLDGLATSPIVSGTTLDDVFTAVPLARRGDGTLLVRRLEPAPGPTGSIAGAALRTARRRLEAFADMLDPGNELADDLEELLLVAEGADLRSRERAAYLDELQARIERQLGLIRVPGNRSITLTARTGEIPVTIVNQTGHRVHVRVEVASDKLEFPDGAVRDIDLTRRNTTERFAVRARSSGDFPLRVRLVSPHSELELGRSRFTVRSTAASGVGLVILGAAAAFLVVWWAPHLVRGRRNRRLVPA